MLRTGETKAAKEEFYAGKKRILMLIICSSQN